MFWSMKLGFCYILPEYSICCQMEMKAIPAPWWIQQQLFDYAYAWTHAQLLILVS